MVTRKCPKCGRMAEVRLERVFKASEKRTNYSCSACGATWRATHTPRKPPKREHGLYL